MLRIPFIITILNSAHNSNDDARIFLEHFLPLLLSRDISLQDAFNDSWRLTECADISLHFKKNDKKEVKQTFFDDLNYLLGICIAFLFMTKISVF